MATKEKKRGLGLDMKAFVANDRRTYLVFRTPVGSFHAFKEVQAKQAARECGAMIEKNTREMWKSIWTK